MNDYIFLYGSAGANLNPTVISPQDRSRPDITAIPDLYVTNDDRLVTDVNRSSNLRFFPVECVKHFPP